MYKAINTRTSTEVVILNPEWLSSIESLRDLGRQDLLVCQGCRQPVRVRAGEHRREHFAHKHLDNCTYSDESSTLLNLRAALYQWLLEKFGKNVEIEKSIVGLDRPVDCWVEKGGVRFAYWIIEGKIKSEKRDQIRQVLSGNGVRVNWVLSSEILRTHEADPLSLILSTTEREFIQRSKYDMEAFTDGSLHYLDPEKHTLKTYRALYPIHPPQVYKARTKHETGLVQLLALPSNGEFVHPGEHQEWEHDSKTPNSGRNSLQFIMEQEEMMLREQETWAMQLVEPESPFDEAMPELVPDHEFREPISESDFQGSIIMGDRAGLCVFCGELTTDYWWINGKTNQCKCRECAKKGKY